MVVGRRGRRGREEEDDDDEEEQADIKSNKPHLTGGEKQSCGCTITTPISSGFMSIAKIATDATSMDNEHSKIGCCCVGEVF